MPYCTGDPSNVKSNCANEKCLQPINEYQNYFNCDKCAKNYHIKCCKLFGQHIQKAAEEKEWFCKECKECNLKNKTSSESSSETDITQKRKLSANADDQPQTNASKKQNTNNDSDFKYEEILKCLKDIQSSNSELKNSVDAIKENQTLISNQFEQLDNKIKTIDTEHIQLKKDVCLNEKILKDHALTISEMEAEIDALKQRDLNNNIVIANLPHEINPNETLSNILNLLKSNATINDIADIKMLPNKSNDIQNKANPNNSKVNINNNNKKNSVMLVTFKNYSDKIDFMIKKKNKKSIFTREINLNSTADHQVFIRDHVTSFKMKLFNDCRKLKEQFNFRHLWMNGTGILLRKNDNTKVFSIKSHIDIQRLEQVFSSESEQLN